MIAEQIRKFFGFMQKDVLINKSNPPNNFKRVKVKTVQKPSISICRNLYSRRSSGENHLVARCMEFLAKSVSSVKICLDEEYSQNKQCFNLLNDLLKEPNQYDDQIAFIEGIVFCMLRTGFAYVVIDFRSKIEMTCIDPSFVTPKFTKEELSGFIINGQTIDKKFVIPIRDTGQSANLSNNGKSKCDLVKPLVYLIDNMVDHNSALIINTPKLSGVVSLKDPTSKQNQEKIRESIEDKFYTSNYVPILSQGIEWKENQHSRELDYMKSYEFLKEQIITIFGIPPQFMSQSGHTGYNTYAHARRHWFEDEVLPMTRRILTALEKGLNIFFQEADPDLKIKLALDTSKVPGFNDANQNLYRQKVSNIE